MDGKIIQLASEEKWTKLTDLLNKLDDDELDDLVDARVLRGRDDPLVLLRAIFRGSALADAASQHRRLHIFLHCVDILQKNELSSKGASQLVGILMLETDAFPALSLAELATKFVDSVKNGMSGGKSLELFPKVLSALARQERVMYGNATMKGEEYKSHVINSVCTSRWSSDNVVHLAAMFKDVPLTSDELKFVIEKILRVFKDLDIQDLPALVYQLLLLSSKGHKRLVLEGVTSFFIEQDKVILNQEQRDSEDDVLETSYSCDSLRHTEGTIILHTMFAMKQDQELGREFVKYLKSSHQNCPSRVLAPFNLALALSAARIHRFEDQIFDFLKATIVKSFKDVIRRQHSKWVSDVVEDSCDIQDLVLETVQNSKYGWDYVTQGLVQMGFLLMDSFGPKGAFGRIEAVTLPATGPSHSACQLGAKILINTFKVHDVVRSEILDQIFNRVITKATSPVSHYLDLLSQLVEPCPQTLLDSIPKVREALDYLAYLPPCSADGLLQALQPLLKLSMSLKDALLLVLRKAMFSKQLDSRKIGVNGFLMLLKHFRVLGGLPSSQSSQSSASSSSQVLVDVHCRANSSSNEGLCLEILGNLRRCFTQQADVRLILYQGLYEVLCRNTKLHEPILELLLSQVKKYYEEVSDVLPPLKLKPCITAQSESVYLAEPLAHLIGCVSLCLLKCSTIGPDATGDHDDDLTNHSQEELQKVMTSLTERMIKCEMEDFELDKSADFSLANSVGKKNSIVAILVMGIYETLMEYNFINGQFSPESCEAVLGLYDNYHKLNDLLREKGSTAAGKKGKASGPAKPPQNIMSLACLQKLLKALYSDNDPNHQGGVSVLQDHVEFCQYVMTAIVHKLQQIQQKGRTQGIEGTDKLKQFNTLSQIGRCLLKYYIEHQQGNRKGKSSGLVSASLEGTALIVNIVTSQYHSKLKQALQIMESSSATERDLSDCISSQINRYQRLVMNLLSSKEEEVAVKDVPSLLAVIGCLYKRLPPSGDHYKEVYHWLQKLCTDQDIDNQSVCKLLFTHVLAMSKQVKSCLPLLRDIAQDIHVHLGDIDQEVEIEDSTNFSLITPRFAAPSLVLLLLTGVEEELDDTEWVINRLRADFQALLSSGEDLPGPTQSDQHEKSVCTRLGSLITVFHELVQSAVPVGLCAENTLKQITRLYSALAAFVKFYLTLYTQKVGHVTGKFEKLVKLSGTHLTQQVYAFITYVQTCDNEQVREKLDKGKKDKKKSSAALQAGRAKVMKESKLIPNVVFAIEQYERYLIQLTKKSKLDLMVHIKQSTARDFRINVAALNNAMEPSSDAEGSEESDQEQSDAAPDIVSDEENQAPDEEPPNTAPSHSPPPAKKSRLGKTKAKRST